MAISTPRGLKIRLPTDYRFHANRLGKSTDVSVSEEELAESNWDEVLNDFAIEWPNIVQRFTD